MEELRHKPDTTWGSQGNLLSSWAFPFISLNPSLSLAFLQITMIMNDYSMRSLFFSPIFCCLSCNSLLQIDGFSLLRGIHMNTKSGEPSEAHPDYRRHVCAVWARSVVSDTEIPWTAACQALLSMGFSRQECWSGLPCPPPGDYPDPRIEPASLFSPVLAGRFFTACTTWNSIVLKYWLHFK